MFSFAIWDANKRQLLLARDRFGIKPLYLASDAGSLAFASEMKALLQVPWVDRSWDATALSAYLRLGYVPSHVHCLPGHQEAVAGNDWRSGPGTAVEGARSHVRRRVLGAAAAKR